jgi:hypothetical protein
VVTICSFVFFALMYVIRLKLPPPAGSNIATAIFVIPVVLPSALHKMIVTVVDQTLPITCEPASTHSFFSIPFFSFIVAHYKVYNRFETPLPAAILFRSRKSYLQLSES